jgi:hypothetical protein
MNDADKCILRKRRLKPRLSPSLFMSDKYWKNGKISSSFFYLRLAGLQVVSVVVVVVLLLLLLGGRKFINRTQN